jgi:hypothetical protein
MKQAIEKAAIAPTALDVTGDDCYPVSQPYVGRAAADSSVLIVRRLADECPTHEETMAAVKQQERDSAAANSTASVPLNASASSSTGFLHMAAALQPAEHVAMENSAAGVAALALADVPVREAEEMQEAWRAAPAPMKGIGPPASSDSAQSISTMQMLVGSRLLALAPDGDAATWVPARVIAERTVGRTTQYKISLDGYDSETDEWLEPQSRRVRPHTVVADAKEAAAQGKREADTARRRAEGRRAEGYELHHHAMRYGEESA